jgi:FtsP/CotA-like multicopper oxidase with cupredoxin domain
MHFRNCGMSKSALRRESQPRTKFNGRSIWPDSCFSGVRGCVVAVGLVLLTQVARAEDVPPELLQPPELVPLPICSAEEITPELKDQHICEVTPVPGTDRHEIKVNLEAHTSEIEVGGYKVTTEHYNRSYLTPVIEALPGDTVLAHLENSLDDLKNSRDGGQAMTHGDLGVNPTNLHYFHGGIVSPNNAWPMDARKGTGDNVYVWLKNGTNSKHDFEVPIPGIDKFGVGELDARVLEGVGRIAHPTGLNWWHSHLHGRSSDQVMGGMSGLLSVGKDKEAVKARCNTPTDLDKCNKDTDKLQKRTIVKYAMLRDITLNNTNASPTWAPEQEHKNFIDDCKVWKSTGDQGDTDPKLREGFCQRDKDSAWLFTLNGQRFPKITVKDGENLLLRLGNLSPNVAYWLELENVTTRTKIPLTVVSLDGVVPARPLDPKSAAIPVDALEVNDLLLMPASRAEIYVRNDSEQGHPGTQIYVLRTKGLKTNGDRWPEIQLARIVLEPSKPTNGIALALNVPIAKYPSELFILLPIPNEPIPPPHSNGCVRDLNDLNPSRGPRMREHRLVTFRQADPAIKLKYGAEWGIDTDIRRPPLKVIDKLPVGEEGDNFALDEDAFESDNDASVSASFEQYEQTDGSGGINWDGVGGGPKHVCIHIDNKDPDHKVSHKQLWVLSNSTGVLHNFHIHQMKFRLATLDELLFDYHILPPPESHTCTPESVCTCTPDAGCTKPDYKRYDVVPDPKTIWHDTIPVPPGQVFIIMSFDDPLQVGRYVYHCHILKHEDKGLMAPIEVWKDS